MSSFFAKGECICGGIGSPFECGAGHSTQTLLLYTIIDQIAILSQHNKAEMGNISHVPIDFWQKRKITLRSATPSDRDGTASIKQKRYQGLGHTDRRWKVAECLPAATLQQVGKWHADSRTHPSMV
jgi:hypothetical protein